MPETKITNLGDKESTTSPGLQLRPEQTVFQSNRKCAGATGIEPWAI